jgi:hypothetical protein
VKVVEDKGFIQKQVVKIMKIKCSLENNYFYFVVMSMNYTWVLGFGILIRYDYRL